MRRDILESLLLLAIGVLIGFQICLIELQPRIERNYADWLRLDAQVRARQDQLKAVEEMNRRTQQACGLGGRQ